MTEHINLNNDWYYCSEFQEAMLETGYDASRMESVRIPHTNVITPFHYFDEQIYQMVSCYRRSIYAKQEWRGKRILLTFEAVGHLATIYLNGAMIMEHKGGYTAFTVDLALYLRFGEDNLLVVKADSREMNAIPPFGNVIDYLTYGGIYREVTLQIKEKAAFEDIFIMTREVDNREGHHAKEAGKEVELLITLYEAEQEVYHHPVQCVIKDKDGNQVYEEQWRLDQKISRHTFTVDQVKNWDVEDPLLYNLELRLYAIEGKEQPLEEYSVRFGFRTCEFKKDGFYLNHRKVKLVGLNRHQSFPYVGYAMPKRQQYRDAELLKQELRVNAVRTSHYPQSRHFIDRCDELGLLVFTEIPGWQHIGDDEWKDIAVNHVEEMIRQYRNHPSIILWGVRINESQDDDEFYTKTNQLAHALDPTRQTGGVRYLQKSHLLEDVYMYNDFLHNGITAGLSRKEEVTSDRSAPYLVSEFNGHMYPTKSFDDETHRLNHALRHACVLDALFEQEDIAGGFGWCMFDYNTHRDFGSGDHICYHGVMDMFRNSKPAAAVYASQSENDTVCEISSSLDIGDHPAGNIREIYAFTNADSVRLYKNDQFVKEFYPSDSMYRHLPHPPILVDDFVGELLEQEEQYSHKTAEAMKQILQAVKEYGPNQLPLRYKLKMAWLMLTAHLTLEDGARLYYKYIGGWGGQATAFRFDAVKNNTIEKTVIKSPSAHPQWSILVDTLTLEEEATYDVAAIRIRAVDEWGNLLPYYQEPITLQANGTVALVGPQVISLKGGMGGTYVKTIGVAGKGELHMEQPQLGTHKLEFTVVLRK